MLKKMSKNATAHKRIQRNHDLEYPSFISVRAETESKVRALYVSNILYSCYRAEAA